MIVLCHGYTAKPMGNGQIELTIVSAQPTALGEQRLSIQEIATALNKSKKAIDKLSRRKKNPLPLIRGNGRPYAFSSSLNRWLIQNDTFPMGIGNSLRSVTG